MRELVKELAAIKPRPKGNDRPEISIRQAVVQSVQVGSVTIRIGGSTTDISGVKYYAHYTPTVSDTVDVLFVGPDPRILGILA